jgi:hypothetical protein
MPVSQASRYVAVNVLPCVMHRCGLDEFNGSQTNFDTGTEQRIFETANDFNAIIKVKAKVNEGIGWDYKCSVISGWDCKENF